MGFYIDGAKDSSFQYSVMNDNSKGLCPYHKNLAKDNHNDSFHENQRGNQATGFHISNTGDQSFQRTDMNDNSEECSRCNSAKDNRNDSTHKFRQANRSNNKGKTNNNIAEGRRAVANAPDVDDAAQQTSLHLAQARSAAAKRSVAQDELPTPPDSPADELKEF